MKENNGRVARRLGLEVKPKKVKASQAKWIKAVPATGTHGSGKLQKRLWRLVSDYTRLRDFYEWKVYVDTGTRIENWHESDAGHYHPYSVCNGMFKFHEMNIHAQSPDGNAWGGASIGHRFAERLMERYGEDYPDKILRENAKYHGTTINDSLVIDKMKDILSKMKDLPEKPAYYDRAIELLERQEA